ncbi:MAG: carboxypeptidase regulatory-like domain-containing protein [Candidatus Cloacimonetes bacterium]|nr:carboxypeptidase regulatory-like domain-containing protein [Candidatus Cloacimonadota bacterium]
MKIKLFSIVLLIIVIGTLCAQQQAYLPTKVPNSQAVPARRLSPDQTRNAPDWTFIYQPTNLMTSYYDYMIGSYGGFPVQAVPAAFGGGYFLTFMGKRTPTGTRRVFFCYINDNGFLEVCYELTNVVNNEGYSSLVFDPVAGKPLYSWHENADADTEYEVRFVSDAFIIGIPGLMNDITTVINNPTTITSPSNITTMDNEFIWPQNVVGPSPIPGKRRIYVLAQNSVTHSDGPVGNAYIAYADFNANDIEYGTILTWSYTSIPEMNNWNVETEIWRRPSYGMTVDNSGNLYVMGYHTSMMGATSVIEPDVDVFICSNYGQGTWSHHSFSSAIPSWNPPTQFGQGPGYFLNASGIPYQDNELTWELTNSTHFNVTIDNLCRIQIAGLWSLCGNDGTYMQNLNCVRNLIYDPNTQTCESKLIYPQTKNPSGEYQPWDLLPPYGQADGYTSDGNPRMVTDWNYPHWDDNLHDNAMMFHYSYVRLTQPTASGKMAVVWQNSGKARQYNYFMNPENAAYENSPEIMISISEDNGNHWCDPIRMSGVNVTQLATGTPMWVCPGNTMLENGNQAELALMYYADYSWGAYVLAPPAQPMNDGGIVKFTPLSIDFGSIVRSGIHGILSYPLSSTPIVGAEVTCNNQTVFTNELGYFCFDLSPGGYTLTFESPLSQTLEMNNVNVFQDEYTIVYASPVILDTVVISGTVTGGVPPTLLYGADISLNGPVAYNTQTDANGAFSLDSVVSTRTYTLSVTQPGFEEYTTQLTIGTQDMDLGNIHLNELALVPQGLEAEILEGNDAVLLEWLSPQIPAPGERSLSQSRDRSLLGYYVFRFPESQQNNPDNWLQLGYYSNTILACEDTLWQYLDPDIYLYAIMAEYSNENYSETVLSNPLSRDIHGSLTGMVTDLDNNPLQGAQITLTRTDGLEYGYSTVSTPNGGYNIGNVRYGSYVVEVSREGFQPSGQIPCLIIQNEILNMRVALYDSLFAPVSVTASVLEGNQVSLITWEAPVSERNIIGYRIWCLAESEMENQENWSQVFSEIIDQTSCEDIRWESYEPGTYLYAVKAVYSQNLSSDVTFSNALEKTTAVTDPVNEYDISGIINAYPNPLRHLGKLTLEIQVKRGETGTLGIYNLLGQKIKTYQLKPGMNILVWDARDGNNRPCASGIYFYKLNTPGLSQAKRFMIIR